MDSPTSAVVVAGHICLDVIPALSRAPDLRPGRLVETGPAALSTGGAVANVGRALDRLGVSSRLTGKVGDDAFGHVVLDLLGAAGPGLAAGMIVAAGETTSYSIVISAPDVDRAFLHCAGANMTFTAADVPAGALAGARILHFGYPPLMRRFYADGGDELHMLFSRARAHGLVTSLDLSDPDPQSEAGRIDWAALLARALPVVDIFAPSVDELSIMLPATSATAATPATPSTASTPGLPQLRALAGRSLEMGAAVIALKLGDRGLYLRTTADPNALARICDRLGLNQDAWQDREVLAPCFRATRVAGTTGAGDCTIAGLLAALLRGDDPQAAATAATAVGACSVEAPDATSGIPPWPEIAARIAAGWDRHPPAPELVGAAA